MHCVHFFVLAFLGVASTTPIKNNLIDDLGKAAEETELLLKRERLQGLMEVTQKVIDSQRIQQKDVAKWQAYHDKLAFCIETWAKNGQTVDCRDYLPDEIEPMLETPGEIYYYTNGTFIAILSKYLEFEGQKHAELITKAEQIIHASREAGYTDKDFDLLNNISETSLKRKLAELLRYIKYNIINNH